MFKRAHKVEYTDRVEEAFMKVAGMTKDLSKAELTRLIDGVTLTWEAWQKIRQARPAEEKGDVDIENAEKILSEI